MGELVTPRLVLRRFSEDDAPFVLALLNDPDWLRYIGDNAVRTLDDARAYLREGPLAMYARFGFGLLAVDLKDGGQTIGMCGLIQRDGVADVDLGFALLPGFRARGLAREAASAVLALGHETLGIPRIVAFTAPDNDRSARLLDQIGMRLERTTVLPNSAEELLLFASGLPSGP
ncbi:MAG: GNAT family N-acetyltransferase [Chromatiales bacterium]|nr:GNAT family N-acetyltransferase [Chromatiales bacterium]